MLFEAHGIKGVGIPMFFESLCSLHMDVVREEW